MRAIPRFLSPEKTDWPEGQMRLLGNACMIHPEKNCHILECTLAGLWRCSRGVNVEWWQIDLPQTLR